MAYFENDLEYALNGCDHNIDKYQGYIVKVLDTHAPQRINYRISYQEVFLGKGVLKICSKFPGEHPCRSVISIKMQSNFIEITLQHGCSPETLLHIFRTPFSKNTSGRLLLKIVYQCINSISIVFKAYQCRLPSLVYKSFN